MSIMNIPARQGGKSAIGNFIVLVLIGFGVWVGIQFIPQKLEEASVRSMLDDVQHRHNMTPIREDADLWRVIDRQLLVNEMRDMRENIRVSREGGALMVTVRYERELNLLVTRLERPVYESIVLN